MGVMHMHQRHLVFLLAISLLAAGVIGGCGRSQPKIQQVNVGMTVAQVETVLGKPMYTTPPAVGSSTSQSVCKVYRGDGNHSIIVCYDNGKATFVKENVPPPFK